MQMELDRQARTAWSKCGLPLRHRQKAEEGSIAGWPDPEAFKSATQATLNKGLLGLVGPRGTGKTQMAAAIMYERYINAGWHTLYSRADDLMDILKRTQRGDTEADLLREMNRLARINLLVIDELQERMQTEFEDRALTRLLDKRYGNMKATILIANLKPEELQTSLGESTLSRMQETGTVVVCQWSSFRDLQTSTGTSPDSP